MISIRNIANGLVLISLLAPALAWAELKIGYVSPARVTDEVPQAEAARKKLEEEFAPRNKELVAKRSRLRDLEERMQAESASMSDAEQQSLQRRIVSKRRDLKRAQDAFREDLNLRRNEELAELQQRIIRTISQFARDADYDLIVSDGVFYASDSVDLTDRIIQQLQTEFERKTNNGR